MARPLLRALAPGLVHDRPKALGLLEYARSWAGLYLLRRGLFLPDELKTVMDPDLAREGLRRLRPLRRLAANLSPDPGADVGRVCALESAHYLRNQLLRDADWAGMAHGVEIRTPLVDVTVIEELAPTIPSLAPQRGKEALAQAPADPLPANIVARAKTGFGVPTGAWMDAAIGKPAVAARGRPIETKGFASRRWSQAVLHGFA
jgi:asparagine synthase (glutamine-hydrolysing)